MGGDGEGESVIRIYRTKQILIKKEGGPQFLGVEALSTQTEGHVLSVDLPDAA